MFSRNPLCSLLKGRSADVLYQVKLSSSIETDFIPRTDLYRKNSPPWLIRLQRWARILGLVSSATGFFFGRGGSHATLPPKIVAWHPKKRLRRRLITKWSWLRKVLELEVANNLQMCTGCTSLNFTRSWQSRTSKFFVQHYQNVR